MQSLSRKRLQCRCFPNFSKFFNKTDANGCFCSIYKNNTNLWNDFLSMLKCFDFCLCICFYEYWRHSWNIRSTKFDKFNFAISSIKYCILQKFILQWFRFELYCCCRRVVLSVFDHFVGLALKRLIHYAPIPQNGQTHSNNSSANCRRVSLSVFDHFVELTLKSLSWNRLV